MCLDNGISVSIDESTSHPHPVKLNNLYCVAHVNHVVKEFVDKFYMPVVCLDDPSGHRDEPSFISFQRRKLCLTSCSKRKIESIESIKLLN